MTEVLLGIDVGTTYCKAAAVGLDGSEQSQARVRTPWREVPTGAEMEPERLAEAVIETAQRALATVPGRVLGVGVTSMAETGALIDSGGESVAPAIAWHDERGETEAAALAHDLGGERFTVTTGIPASRLCTLAKYAWLRRHHDDARRGVRWLNVAEWVVRSLGGDEVADLSLAARTGFLDLDRADWWVEAADWSGAPRGLLPAPVPPGTPAGRVGAVLPEARGAVLTTAGHDHACGALGAGAARPGDLFDSCGSAEALVRAIDPPLAPDGKLRAVAGGLTVGWHVIPGRQLLMGAFLSGLTLERLAHRLGAAGTEARAELDRAALNADAEDGDGGREGAPAIWRGAHEELARHGAVLLSMIEAVAGPTRRTVVAGGVVRSEVALAARRASLGALERAPVQEAGARGAALLAGCAAGAFGGVDELPAPEPAREAMS